MLYRYTKQIFFFVVLPLMLWISSSCYFYCTEQTTPRVELIGIAEQGCYNGLVPCAFKAQTSYKISELIVTLDEKPFDFNHSPYIGKRSFERSFPFDTLPLTDGAHIIEFEAIDASYNKNRAKTKISFYVDNAPLNATFVAQEYKVAQGHTLHAHIQANKKLKNAEITFLSKVYRCNQTSPHSLTYECFIPIDCECESNVYQITATVCDHVQNSIKLQNTLTVLPYDFPKQKGFVVSQQKLSEEKELSLNTKILEDALEKWTALSPQEKKWTGPFELPTIVRKISTPFGEIRMTPERGRYLHKAIDIVNHPRSVIWASQDGTVIIKERYLLPGNTIVLDHGLGIFSLYFHLEEFADIEVGDFVKKGSPLGKLGKTGYAAGYHLHWEIRVNNVQVDPMEWTNKSFWS